MATLRATLPRKGDARPEGEHGHERALYGETGDVYGLNGGWWWIEQEAITGGIFCRG